LIIESMSMDRQVRNPLVERDTIININTKKKKKENQPQVKQVGKCERTFLKKSWPTPL
jgi:hypothetical protein